MSEKYETVTQTTEVRKYKPFEGQNRAQMQRLLTGRDQETGEQVDVPRILLFPRKLIYIRCEGESGDREYMIGSYIDVNVSSTPNPHGDEIKFTLDDQQIKTLTANTELEQGALPTSQDQYDSKNGFILSGSEVQEFRNNPYALPKKRREFWEFLAEGDTALAKKYEKDVTESLGLKYDNVMGLWLPESKGMRLLCVGAVRGSAWDSSRSYADGALDDVDGRLVGVAPEAQDISERSEQSRAQSEKPLEDRIQTALSAGKAFRYNGRLYVPTDADLEIKE